MTYTIKNSMKTGEYEGKYGKLYKYTVQLEGESDAVELSQKPTTPEPKTGDILEGIIEETQYGKKFKKIETSSGNSKSDPATQKAIIRQNALTNAVNYVIAKAQLMKPEEGMKYMSGKEVVQVATYFAKYSMGEVTVVTESEKDEVVTANKVTSEATNEEVTPEDMEAMGF